MFILTMIATGIGIGTQLGGCVAALVRGGDNRAATTGTAAGGLVGACLGLALGLQEQGRGDGRSA